MAVAYTETVDRDTPSLIETLTGLAILVAVGAQTWIVVQEATQGDAGRWVRHWWTTRLRPLIVRAVMWVDARALVEAMITDEIVPLLGGDG